MTSLVIFNLNYCMNLKEILQTMSNLVSLGTNFGNHKSLKREKEMITNEVESENYSELQLVSMVEVRWELKVFHLRLVKVPFLQTLTITWCKDYLPPHVISNM